MEPTRSERRGAPTVASILVLVLVGVGALTYDALHQPPVFVAESATSQLAATAASGDCQQRYDTCMSTSGVINTLFFVDCEGAWQSCVKNKCVKKDTATVDNCPKDPDCISSCTASVAANGDLKNCCSVIAHNNQCRTKVEGSSSCLSKTTAIPSGTPPAGTLPSTGAPTPTPSAGTPPTPTAPTTPAPTQSNFWENPPTNQEILNTKAEDLPPGKYQIDNNTLILKYENGYTAVIHPDETGTSFPPGTSNIFPNTPTVKELVDHDQSILGNIGGLPQTPAPAVFIPPTDSPGNGYITPNGFNEYIPGGPQASTFLVSENTANPFDSGKVPQDTFSANLSSMNFEAKETFSKMDGSWATMPDPNAGRPTQAEIQADAAACSSGDTAACTRVGVNPDAKATINTPANCAGQSSGDCFNKPPTTTLPPGNKPTGADRPNPSGPGPGDSKTPSGGQNGLGQLLSGLMQGLGKALATPQAPPAAPAQACSTDPNAYAQQQQQYQQQLQQYNYQLQQYQYQQQLAQYQSTQYGGYSSAPTAPLPAQPTPCTPGGSQCTSQPQQPAASTCTNGQWRPTYSGSCITSWQCSDLGASLSCSPKIADVGSTLTFTYSCAKGTASSQSFTASSTSGTATTTVAQPPLGANTATYNLSCSDGTVTSGAQCSVQVSQPSIILVANPAHITSGSTSLVGWLTTGMQSCVVSSPSNSSFTAQNASNTSVTGTAQTPVLTATTEFGLTCLTVTGQSRSASTTVAVLP